MKNLILILAVISSSITYGQGNRVKFKSRSFTPPIVAEKISDINNIQNERLFCIQFYGPIDIKTLTSAGVQVLQYIPDNTYQVRVPKGVRLPQETIVTLRSVFTLLPTDKISPELAIQLHNQPKHININVRWTKDKTKEELTSILNSYRAKIIEDRWAKQRVLSITVPSKMVLSLADHPYVSFLDLPFSKDEVLRYKALQTERANYVHHANGGGLSGANVVIGLGDNGKLGEHIDFGNRINERSSFGEGLHATHVAGILTGEENLDPSSGRGMAPGADVITQNFSDILVNTQRYYEDYGMVVTNNSYGNNLGNCSLAGDYNLNSIIYDEQLCDLPEVLHVFASGNDGTKTCFPYAQGYATVLGGYQSAKNVITVGSVLNTEGISSFSSRGPVDDGRIKPELVAVGSAVVSTRPNNNYAGGPGTSYSCPAVTGAVALLYEKYRQLYAGANPSGNLIKAILCNSADDMGNPGPDYLYGFGRINVRKAVACLNEGSYYTNTLGHGQTAQYIIPVGSNVSRIKIMLSWRDPAASEYATETLVNDIDMVVTDPSSSLFLPWTLLPSPVSVSNNAIRNQDHSNPQEQITIENPISGNYIVDLSGYNIPLGPQNYVLTYTIEETNITVTYPNIGEQLIPESLENIRWDAVGVSNNLTVSYSDDNGASWNIINDNVSPSVNHITWTTPSSSENQMLVSVAENTTSISDTSDGAFIVLYQPTGFSSTSPCDGYAEISWTASSDAIAYAIFLFDGNTMVEVDTTLNLNYLLKDLNPGENYWVSVSAIDGAFNRGRRISAINVSTDGGQPCPWTNDVGVTEILVPSNGRQFTSSALSSTNSVTIRVRNYGSDDLSNVPVNFKIGLDPIVSDIIPFINAGSSVDFTFSGTADLSLIQNYNIVSWTGVLADSHPENNKGAIKIKHVSNPLVTLPFFQGFEGMQDTTVTKNTFSFPGAEQCDYNQSGNGRLRSFAGLNFISDGNRAITLDNQVYGLSASNYLLLTINLSGYNASVDDVRLNFDFVNHEFISDDDTDDLVWVRGNDLDAWIPLYDLFLNRFDAGIYNHVVSSIEISDTLTAHGQNFSSSFQLRFGQEGTASADEISLEDGYTFDNINLYTATNDVAAISLDTPGISGCGLGIINPSINISNKSAIAVAGTSVSYRVNGGSVVSETIPIISGDTEYNHTFATPFDFSAVGTYLLDFWLSAPGDSYALNDSLLNISIQNYKSVTNFPYIESFEQDNGDWYTSGSNSSWSWGKPSGINISKAAEGTMAWVTNLSGHYNDEEYSYLYSPCFDLSVMSMPSLAFSTIYNLETVFDFAWVEYSLDGMAWQKLGLSGMGYHWYDLPTIEAWNGNDNVWRVASYDLPSGSSEFRLRFVFDSDEAVSEEGLGIDDIHIYDKNEIYLGPTQTGISAGAVSGTTWVDISSGSDIIASINPLGNNLGITTLDVYFHLGSIRDNQVSYLLNRSWRLASENDTGPVKLRLYFTDSEVLEMLSAAGCSECVIPQDVFRLSLLKYSGINEDGQMGNNATSEYQSFDEEVIFIIPIENGYYAEVEVDGFSEFWITTPALPKEGGFLYCINSSSDDAEEHPINGSVNLYRSVIDLVNNQSVGLRFQNIEVPKNSFINNAYIQFTSSAIDEGPCQIQIQLESNSNPSTYSTGNYNISSRSQDSVTVSWVPSSWTTIHISGEDQKSPELRHLLQDAISNPLWSPGNSLSFLLSGTGKRQIHAFDGDPSLAAKLYIEFDTVCSLSHRLYVDVNATGKGTGIDWNNAVVDLQEAIRLATHCNEINEIWVKVGEYLPAKTYNSEASFVLPSDVSIYGGFDGSELTPGDRDLISNVTCLNGSVEANNVYHVIRVLSGISNTYLDGLTIKNGNANGIDIENQSGGGIYNEGVLALKSIIVENCSSIGPGPDIYNTNSANILFIGSNTLKED